MTVMSRKAQAIEVDLAAAIDLVASFRELPDPQRTPDLPMDCGSGMVLPALTCMVRHFNDASDAPYAEFPPKSAASTRSSSCTASSM